MRKKHLATAAALFCCLFMYGCVASEGDVGFIYTRQKDIEANLKKAEKDIEWLKAEVSDEDANLELKEQFHELQNKVLELEQAIGTVHSGVETVKTDLRRSAGSAAGKDETGVMKERIEELEARVSRLELTAEAPGAEAAKTPAAPSEAGPGSVAVEEEPESPEPAAAEAADGEPRASRPEAARPEPPAEKPGSPESESAPAEAPAQAPQPANAEAAGDEPQPAEPAASPETEEPAEPESPEPAAESKGDASHYDLGQRKLAEGKYRDARVLFRKYADANPVAEDAPEAVFLIADSYFMEELYEEAILEYQNLIDIYPDSPRVTTSQLKQGMALMEIEKTDEAALFFESLIESHPRSPEAAEAEKYLKKIKAPKAAE